MTSKWSFKSLQIIGVSAGMGVRWTWSRGVSEHCGPGMTSLTFLNVGVPHLRRGGVPTCLAAAAEIRYYSLRSPTVPDTWHLINGSDLRSCLFPCSLLTMYLLCSALCWTLGYGGIYRWCGLGWGRSSKAPYSDCNRTGAFQPTVPTLLTGGEFDASPRC